MEELISSLESLARQICVENNKIYTFTTITDQKWEDDSVCWICENDFPTLIKWYLLPLHQQYPGLST